MNFNVFVRTYDGFNHLVRIQNDSGSILEEFLWHPTEEKILIKKIYNSSGDVTQRIVYVNENTVKIKNSSGTFYEHYILQDGVIVAQRDTDGNKQSIHNDYLGSASLITDGDGNTIDSSWFSPFGEQILEGEKSRYDYTGKEKDSVTGEYDFDARMYKSEWGRMLQIDPIIQNPYIPISLNHYAYAWNNPYGAIDPNGKTVVTISGGPPANPFRGISEQFLTMENQIDSSLDIPIQNYNSGVSVDTVRDFVSQQADDQPLVLIGYSWGGGDALRVAEALEADGIDVDSVITIDPFQRGTFSSEDTSPTGIDGNGININLYQTNPAPRVGSHGNPKNGMLNLDVGQIENLGTNINHYNIMDNRYVQTVVVGVVNSLHQRGGSGTGGGIWSNVIADPSGRKDRFGNPVYIKKPSTPSKSKSKRQ